MGSESQLGRQSGNKPICLLLPVSGKQLRHSPGATEYQGTLNRVSYQGTAVITFCNLIRNNFLVGNGGSRRKSLFQSYGAIWCRPRNVTLFLVVVGRRICCLACLTDESKSRDSLEVHRNTGALLEVNDIKVRAGTTRVSHSQGSFPAGLRTQFQIVPSSCPERRRLCP